MKRFGLMAVLLLWAIPAHAAEGLHCQDFKKIYEFAATEHLRFRSAHAESSLSLLQEATQKIPIELRKQGYSMLAALFERDLHRGSLKKESADKICEELPSGLHRAILIKSFVGSLDPFSEFYMSEELSKRTSVVDGHFVGVGIGTEVKDPFIEVKEIVAGGPSDRKIFLGDLISEVDGYPVRGLDQAELRRRMRGEVGSKVVLKGKRPQGDLQVDFEVTITRNHVYQTAVSSHWAEKGILQIKVHRFFAQTAPLVRDLLIKERPRTKGVILDLRDNPGGLLQAARDLVDLFISKGVVIHMRGTYDDQLWATQSGGFTKLPLVVLINEKSASSSEIVAGALQDYGRALLVGTKTYGKSCIQNIYDTKSGLGTEYEGGVKLTTLWYYLPSGRSVRNLQPDILLAGSKDAAEHLKLPYEWPDQIAVLSQPEWKMAKQKLLNSTNSVIARDASPEDAGRRILKMMAVAQ